MGVSLRRQVAGNARLRRGRKTLSLEMRAETPGLKMMGFLGYLRNSLVGNHRGETAKFLPVCKAAQSRAKVAKNCNFSPRLRAA